jgi:hypothetical protein
MNELLISAHSLRHSFLDNMLAVFSLQLSRLMLTSHYEKVNTGLALLFDMLTTCRFIRKWSAFDIFLTI